MAQAVPIEILMIDDDPGDVRITQEAVKASHLSNRLHVCYDGESGLAFLRKQGEYQNAPTPDLVLLDLNMPGLTGMEVLEAIRADENIKHVPVAILTTSNADADVLEAYKLHANCFVTKPVMFDAFMQVVQELEDFWVSVVKIPRLKVE